MIVNQQFLLIFQNIHCCLRDSKLLNNVTFTSRDPASIIDSTRLCSHCSSHTKRWSISQRTNYRNTNRFTNRSHTPIPNLHNANSFLILVIAAILLAYAYPPIGAIYLAPQITATWIAVMFIFILAGMGRVLEGIY